MNGIKRVALAALGGLLLTSGYASAESLTQVRLVDPLDEPEFYCLDLAGWGDHLRLDDPLQAHTCKTRRANDQMFAFKDGKIVVGDTGRCLEVAGSGSPPLAGAAVLARQCGDNPLQAFTLEASGRIVSTGSDLCLAAGEESADASGPSHVWRVLTVQKCDAVGAELTTWQVGL
jgi:hypothetical protein